MNSTSTTGGSCDHIPTPRYSVFICTRNRTVFLRKCLDALIASASDKRAPIVVIDNGSTDATPTLVEEFSPRVQYVFEGQIGLSYARNRALSMCETGIHRNSLMTTVYQSLAGVLQLQV